MFMNEYMVSEEQELNQEALAHNRQQAILGPEQEPRHPDEPEENENPIGEVPVSTEGSFDSIQSYLNEIGRVPLLTFAEEIELAQRIERGVAARQRLEAGGQIDAQLRAALAADIEQGRLAQQHLTQANLRLVVSIAKKYVGHGMSLMDLIQEGNLGLMRAVEKFDHTRGNRFSTYATWWIRQAVSRALAERSRTIRLPVHLTESIGQIKRAADKLAQALERQPTAEELAIALGQPLEKITRALEAMRQPISLETPVGEDQENTLGSLLADRHQEPLVESASRSLLRQDMARALDELTERERTVLTLRYGLADGQHRTLEDVGRAIGMTRERARQIEGEALRHIRASGVGRHLRDYLE